MVVGKDVHPLFKFLQDISGKIYMNFTKFLIGFNGDVLQRYKPHKNP